MRLINNHYPRVTSFSLLGAPIALAESLLGDAPCQRYFQDVCLFFLFFFFCVT